MTIQPTLFGLDASDIGDIAREAFHDCNDIGGPHWPTVGAKILAELLDAERGEQVAKEITPRAATSLDQASLATFESMFIRMLGARRT